MRKELDQLLTYTADNELLVKISIKAPKIIGSVLVIVTLRFVRHTVVVFIVVKKQFLLNNLSM